MGASTGYGGKTVEDNFGSESQVNVSEVLRKQERQDSFTAELDRGFLFTEMGGITRDAGGVVTRSPIEDALRLSRRWQETRSVAAGRVHSIDGSRTVHTNAGCSFRKGWESREITFRGHGRDLMSVSLGRPRTSETMGSPSASRPAWVSESESHPKFPRMPWAA
jgi:hypothetical protein